MDRMKVLGGVMGDGRGLWEGIVPLYLLHRPLMALLQGTDRSSWPVHD